MVKAMGSTWHLETIYRLIAPLKQAAGPQRTFEGSLVFLGTPGGYAVKLDLPEGATPTVSWDRSWERHQEVKDFFSHLNAYMLTCLIRLH
jgi:hypothetical protein